MFSISAPRGRHFGVFAVLTAILCILANPVRAEIGRAPVSARIVVLDATTLDTLETRTSVVDDTGKERYPLPFDPVFYHEHWIEGLYWYNDGSLDFLTQPGVHEIHLGRGLEYSEIDTTADIQSDTVLVYTLSRQIDMNALGWYSADCQVHIDHGGGYYSMTPADAHFMAAAEDINIAHCLDQNHHFTGAPDPVSSPDHIIYMSAEIRSNTYGHIDVLGLSTMITPFGSTWSPMVMDLADSAHLQPGVLVMGAHPMTTDTLANIGQWPGSGLGREFPIDVIGGRLDGIEVVSYSNIPGNGIETDLYYKLLNCGFRLPPVAGTDAAVNRIEEKPLGGFRVYADLEGLPFNFDNWCSQTKLGRTSVTNGPLFTAFDVGGVKSGDSLVHASGPVTVPVHAALWSRERVERLEIVVGGIVAASAVYPGGTNSIDTTFSITADRSTWIAARTWGDDVSWHIIGDTLFAHTGPAYISIGGNRAIDTSAAYYFVDWLTEFETLVEASGEFDSPVDSLRVLTEIGDARTFYLDLVTTATDLPIDGRHSQGTGVRFSTHLPFPNPFSDLTTFRFFVPSGTASVELTIHDVSGREVRRLLGGSMGPGEHTIRWDGRNNSGGAASDGVYFARLSGDGGRADRRKFILVR